MKRLGFAAATALGALAALAPPSPAQTFGSRTRFTEQGGAAVYGAVCAACHMTNGLGASGAGSYPSLARNSSLAIAAYPVAVVLLGRRAMPSFAETLSDQQIAEVVAFVRTHFGNSYSDGVTAAQVAAARPLR